MPRRFGAPSHARSPERGAGSGAHERRSGTVGLCHARISSPVGATVSPRGVNFSLFSETCHGRRASALRPCRRRAAGPGRSDFTPRPTGLTTTGTVSCPGWPPARSMATGSKDPGIQREACASIRPRSSWTHTEKGSLSLNVYTRDPARQSADCTAVMKSCRRSGAYDWEGDVPLAPAARTIIYEMHVRGFTRHPNSGVDENLRGTYAGVIEKIPYLQQLGITAVELLPVFQFDALDCPPGKVNYWGYAPISFFAPHQAYSSRRDLLGPVDEFRDMVKALHRAGNRGHSRRRIQPYGRGRPSRANRLFPRHRQPNLLHSRRRWRAVRQLHGLWEHT